MSDDPKQQQFAERLRRIEEQRVSEGETPAAQEHRPAPPSPMVPPAEDVRLRNAIIWIFILAAAAAGGYATFQAIPQDVKEAFAALAGIEMETTNEGGDAAVEPGEQPVSDNATEQAEPAPEPEPEQVLPPVTKY